MDDADTGYSEAGTGWMAESLADAYRGADALATPRAGANTATWQLPAFPPAGTHAGP